MKAKNLSTKYTKNDVQKWRKGLERYCARNAVKCRADGYCLCGYMSYCCHCKIGSDKFACVKAIVRLCREKGIEIDYYNHDYKLLVDESGFREDENRKRKES